MIVACGVEYEGAGFSGWQAQPHAPSVQAEVERALSRVANHPVRVFCAGRTDAGVHATGQVVHFETASVRRERAWLLGANTHLPASVRLAWVRFPGDDFHARFSAEARSYRYLILQRETASALLHGRVSWTHARLDIDRMRAGARHLLGEHDFSAYRATACQAHSPVRRVDRLELVRDGDFICLDIEANAFLHHMVRNIAGVLMAIGAGERAPDWSREILQGRDRARGGVTAPAAGLYLVGVRYPARFDLPRSGWLPRFA
ncbi:MAG TPA: tRNA pseudouridine(38-40) synthase TruA [Gammaproteobacteria bacterium]|nr:tRNA pseudouridine(38-40) synthase TruA [Gammaproteobacteria bacterium]